MSDVDGLAALAHAAGRGDKDALSRLVGETYDSVWRYVAHVVDRQCADDLAQETFIRAIRSLPSFRGDCSVVVWLLSIARRTAMDHFRAQGRQPYAPISLLGDPLDVHQAAPSSPDPSAASDLRALIRQLEPERRGVFVLTQILGFSYAETAQVCGIPVGTVRSRVARARGDLVAMLAAADAQDAAYCTPRVRSRSG